MDYNLEDIECGRYQLVFASAENVLVNPFLSSIETILLPSIVYDQMEEKLSHRLTAAVLMDFR